MTLPEFHATLDEPTPPAGIGPLLTALWHDAHGDWDRAHTIAQDVPDAQGGARVHAYLHRKEGDAANAAYWYRRAGQPMVTGSLESEWEALVVELLQSKSGTGQ